MKNFLIVIIILSHLGLGFAYAWDSHPQAIVGHNPLLSAMAIDTDTYQNEPCNDANHCCHGFVHLLSLMSLSTFSVLTEQQTSFSAYHQIVTQLTIPPLFKPPIV